MRPELAFCHKERRFEIAVLRKTAIENRRSLKLSGKRGLGFENLRLPNRRESA